MKKIYDWILCKGLYLVIIAASFVLILSTLAAGAGMSTPTPPTTDAQTLQGKSPGAANGIATLDGSSLVSQMSRTTKYHSMLQNGTVNIQVNGTSSGLTGGSYVNAVTGQLAYNSAVVYSEICTSATFTSGNVAGKNSVRIAKYGGSVDLACLPVGNTITFDFNAAASTSYTINFCGICRPATASNSLIAVQILTQGTGGATAQNLVGYKAFDFGKDE